jgi:hypothetical protein
LGVTHLLRVADTTATVPFASQVYEELNSRELAGDASHRVEFTVSVGMMVNEVAWRQMVPSAK